MPKFRKKPVVIEAVEIRRENYDAILALGHGSQAATIFMGWEADPVYVRVPTLEGEMRGDRGDWLIRGVKGELYPCKPDIFAATYEPADTFTLPGPVREAPVETDDEEG
jgi:hypothetical protein